MTIRVTPIGGEPVELPEDTQCVPRLHASDGGVTFARNDVASVAQSDGADDQSRYVRTLGSVLYDACGQAFVRIGDAWPLCTIETWRQRAERLEEELRKARIHLTGLQAAFDKLAEEAEQ